jgi:hypothetical protein
VQLNTDVNRVIELNSRTIQSCEICLTRLTFNLKVALAFLFNESLPGSSILRPNLAPVAS